MKRLARPAPSPPHVNYALSRQPGDYRPLPDRRLHALAQPLVRPGLIEVGDILAEGPPQVRLADQEHVIEALASDAA